MGNACPHPDDVRQTTKLPKLTGQDDPGKLKQSGKAMREMKDFNRALGRWVGRPGVEN